MRQLPLPSRHSSSSYHKTSLEGTQTFKVVIRQHLKDSKNNFLTGQSWILFVCMCFRGKVICCVELRWTPWTPCDSWLWPAKPVDSPLRSPTPPTASPQPSSTTPPTPHQGGGAARTEMGASDTCFLEIEKKESVESPSVFIFCQRIPLSSAVDWSLTGEVMVQPAQRLMNVYSRSWTLVAHLTLQDVHHWRGKWKRSQGLHGAAAEKKEMNVEWPQHFNSYLYVLTYFVNLRENILKESFHVSQPVNSQVRLFFCFCCWM